MHLGEDFVASEVAFLLLTDGARPCVPVRDQFAKLPPPIASASLDPSVRRNIARHAIACSNPASFDFEHRDQSPRSIAAFRSLHPSGNHSFARTGRNGAKTARGARSMSEFVFGGYGCSGKCDPGPDGSLHIVGRLRPLVISPRRSR